MVFASTACEYHPRMTTLSEIARSTLVAAAALEKVGRGVVLGLMPLDALAEGTLVDFVAWEHDAGTRPPLVEHAYRAVGRNLAALETQSSDAFTALSMDERLGLSGTVSIIDRFKLLPVVRLALVLLDFAKGGSEERRFGWETKGADLTVHNIAASQVLRAEGTLVGAEFDPVLEELLLQMIANHGLAGQFARGETPVAAFRPWVQWLIENDSALAKAIGVNASQAVTLACNAMHLIDAMDTEAVREGLVDDRLLGELRNVRDFWIGAVMRPERLDEHEDLRSRFGRLRRQALEAGEPVARLDAALTVAAPHLEWMNRLLVNAQLWYFEPATHALSSEAALRLLVLGLGQADRNDAVDCARPFHLSFQPLVNALGASDTRTAYRVRLIEALLLKWDLDSLARGEFPADLLAGFSPRIGGTTAVALELQTTPEADALVTLLALYEGRSSVAFHQILKLLCDAYDLRKDEFDRLANEAQYLATMNAARSDKERMLDFVVPGTIVEVGPGGGVVLDLLEARFDDSDIVGLDLSDAVVTELERRRGREGHSWRIVKGDAFEIGDIIGAGTANTVIFCSLLHEIYSYVESEGRKFQMEPVQALLRAAYDALADGGRIIIRDGVKPPPGVRILDFLDPDGPDFLRRFQAEFEGREIGVEWLDDTRARMSAPDAMEFLYCYTWGPASFPYEVREQYGIMERDEYERAVLEWLPGARAVDVPDDLRSYLQPGYETGLASKVRLSDGEGSPVPLPDSNAIWVFEKAAAK